MRDDQLTWFVKKFVDPEKGIKCPEGEKKGKFEGQATYPEDLNCILFEEPGGAQGPKEELLLAANHTILLGNFYLLIS